MGTTQAMQRLISLIGALTIVAAATAPAGAQTAQPPNGQLPPYQPATSTWQEGPPNSGSGHVLLNRPYPWKQTSQPFPLITADFREGLRPHTVRIILDGSDITELAQIKSGGFEVTPAYPLAVGTHVVQVIGVMQDGRHRIADTWSFNVVP
jgi:hypothetical protein